MLPSTIHHVLTLALTEACKRLSPLAGDFAHLIAVEKPQQQAHGDYACPIALSLAKVLRQKPLDIANGLLSHLTVPNSIDSVSIAAPGFINFTLKPAVKIAVVNEILNTKNDYGKTEQGSGTTVLLEFISANPTGPLHIGHGRACVYGDCLSKLLQFNGYTVNREYYVNDAGRQMSILAASTWLRYWQYPMPKGSYQGDYLIPIANKLSHYFLTIDKPDDILINTLQESDSADDNANELIIAWKNATAIPLQKTIQNDLCNLVMSEVIHQDMQALGVDPTTVDFFQETWLHNKDEVTKAVAMMQDKHHLEEKDNALWFKSTDFGDDKNRVVQRSNGEWTYFAADIAYHYNKLLRNDSPSYQLLNVLGADHHGYIPRISAVAMALGFAKEKIETQIIQFVSLVNATDRIKMSTRTGTFITVSELVEQVGLDATRYFFISRKNDQHLDFDISVAMKKDTNNPVYYIQYAKARICNIIKNWGGGVQQLHTIKLDSLYNNKEALALGDHLIRFSQAITRAGIDRAPHLLTVYLHDLARLVHRFYEKNRILPKQDPNNPTPSTDANTDPDTLAKLSLLLAVWQVIDNCGENLLGIPLPEKI